MLRKVQKEPKQNHGEKSKHMKMKAYHGRVSIGSYTSLNVPRPKTINKMHMFCMYLNPSLY
jgi:hypothetical protein